ncbi:peptidoglycan-binding protein [Candidatus Wolfebacteria bacterium]|nr:peptidoglycan-binding protein [Candidatus Wolfebacteria bacterium]
MDPRRAKQIFYGTGFVAFFLLIIIGIYYLWFRPAPSCFDNRQNQNEAGVDCGGNCPACEIRALSPIQTNWTRYFPADNQAVIVSEIKNSNENYGAGSFSYNIDVYDRTGEKALTAANSSFIYASQIKYLIDVLPIAISRIGRIDISIGNPSWSARTQFTQPDLQLREIKTEAGDTPNQGILVKGIIDNRSAFPIRGARITAFLFNQSSEPVSASKTELDLVSSFDSLGFTIAFPKNITLPAPIETPAFQQFTKDLTVGSKGPDVQALQRFLASQGFFKRGATTEVFGPITKQALINFQKKFNITTASGALDSKTRDYINNLNKPQSIATSSSFVADPTKTRVYADGVR